MINKLGTLGLHATMVALIACATLRAAAQAPYTSVATSEAQSGLEADRLGATPLAASLSGQAAIDYDAGRILFDDQDYAGALLKFQRAYADAKDPRLLWNMAACEKNLRHYAAVLRLLDRYLVEGGASMPAAQRREVDVVIKTVRLLVSTVRISVDEAEVAIAVDGEPVATTPLMEPLFVDLGRRELRLTKPGFEEHRIVQEFAGGSEVSFEVVMQPEDRTGRIQVFAGAGQSIRVDGKLVGTGEWSGSLAEGEHTLRVTGTGMRTHEVPVSVQAGQTRALYVSLERDEGGVPAWIWIGAGVVVAGGLAAGGYFLFRSTPEAEPQEGTWATVDL